MRGRGEAVASVLLLAAAASLLRSALAAAAAAAAAGAAVDPVSYLSKVTSPSYHVADVWAAYVPPPNHAEVVKAAPDTWEVLPKAFDKAYRNPCWTDDTGRFRCAPYFQIIGVSKCGTTDLYGRLRRHPDLADGAKGPHFWDECPHPPKGACTAPPNGDFDGYVNLFEKGATQIKSNPLAIVGEASSNTYTGVYTFVRGLARLKTNITLAQLIHAAQPYQRQIIIMRDPVARYYSAFHYYRRKPSEPFEGPDKFHERVERDIKNWKACVARHGQPECVKRYEPQQLVKGMYAEFVDAWTAVFPRQQLLFLRTEDYKAAPREHLQAVMKFLGMRELSDSETGSLMRLRRFNAQSEKYPRMWPRSRKLLEEFYRPFNEKLAALMGNDPRFLWADTAAKAAAQYADAATAAQVA
ncbi:hypothetical protein HYH02_003287 [Chlamydomonas schloesseri]|uniref:Sulfotransferase n=1 Tax=Chlamydomonas schloesseri TaxID=2026947 RepID=A0A835WQK0_9CHLO|nr:hypothetical protein HYH02_003287 [Chlamydomonas schloesseri]|eukprot:KAG2452263.1 hypothetical protein HYH02_003287 [Chlamydomonas schloesseri]